MALRQVTCPTSEQWYVNHPFTCQTRQEPYMGARKAGKPFHRKTRRAQPPARAPPSKSIGTVYHAPGEAPDDRLVACLFIVPCDLAGVVETTPALSGPPADAVAIKPPIPKSVP